MLSFKSDTESSSSENTSYRSNEFLDDDISNESTVEDQSSRRSTAISVQRRLKRYSADQMLDNPNTLKNSTLSWIKNKSENLSQKIEPKNFLELIASELINSSNFLKLGVNSNPLEQIRLVLAFIVSGMYVNGPSVLMKWDNNNNLTTYRKSSENVTVNIRKHDRQLTYSITSHALDFNVEAISEINVSSITTLKTLQAQQISQIIINFKTPLGKRSYNCCVPEMRITGELNSQRILGYTGIYTVGCEDTKLHADVNFQYSPSSSVSISGGRIQNIFYINEMKKVYLNDFVEVDLYKKENIDDADIIIPLDNAQSQWLDKIKFNKFMILKMYEKISRQLKRKLKNESKKLNLKLKTQQKFKSLYRSQTYSEDYKFNNDIFLS